MADIFAVVADHTRRELLGILLRRRSEGIASGDASVSELVAELALSQPTVSKHLKVLREAGLVTVREKGQHRYYRLEPDGLSGVGEWVGPFLPAADGEQADGGPADGGPADGGRVDGRVEQTDGGRVDGRVEQTDGVTSDPAGTETTTATTDAGRTDEDAAARTAPVPGAEFAAVLGRMAADVAFRIRRS
jgi:DNA-binding transcriptional ArsR family regulator